MPLTVRYFSEGKHDDVSPFSREARPDPSSYRAFIVLILRPFLDVCQLNNFELNLFVYVNYGHKCHLSFTKRVP